MIPEMTSRSIRGIRRRCGGEGGEMDVSEHCWSACCLRKADVDDDASIGGARDGGRAASLQTSRRAPVSCIPANHCRLFWPAISSFGLLASFQSSSSTLFRNLSQSRDREAPKYVRRLSLCASKYQTLTAATCYIAVKLSFRVDASTSSFAQGEITAGKQTLGSCKGCYLMTCSDLW